MTATTNPIAWNGLPKIRNDNPYPSNDTLIYDPYHILHLRRDATKAEMKRAYKQLAILYHPTLSISQLSPEVASVVQKQKQLAFALISASYETLANLETRQRMDTLLLQQQPQHFAISNTNRCPKRNKESRRHRMIVISKEEQKLRKILHEERLQKQQQDQKDKNIVTNKKSKNSSHKHVVRDAPKIRSTNGHDMGSIYVESITISADRIYVESSTISADRIIQRKTIPNPVVKDQSTANKSRGSGRNKNRDPRQQSRRRGCDWNSCASSSCYNDSFDTDYPASIQSKYHQKTAAPPLLLSSDSDDSDSASEYACANVPGALVPQSTSDTERWFGGPLKLMYRARRFQPFTDPYALFDRVFESELLSSQQHAASSLVLLKMKRDTPVESSLPLVALGSALAPLSSPNDIIETLKDGVTIKKSQRIQSLYVGAKPDPAHAIVKVISRTATQHPPDLFSGKHRTVIEVTSDYRKPDDRNGSIFLAPSSNMMIDCTLDDDHSFLSFCRSLLPCC